VFIIERIRNLLVLCLDKLINGKLKKTEITQVILNKTKLQNSLFEDVFKIYRRRRAILLYVYYTFLIQGLFIPIFLLQFLKQDLI